MLQARNIDVTIGPRPILHAVDFSAAPGEVTAIIGPNGSGKSTLLKAICGDLASTGDVLINGEDLRGMKPWQAASLRAVLPQSSVLTFPFTVREVVALGLTAGRSTGEPDRLDDLPEQALDRVDLSGFAGRFYQDLSGGEQQRVQLARVLCQVWEPVLDGVPRYLLLDEPVSSLDIKHQLIIMGIAADFARAGGGVVAVLHDLNLTAMFADKVLALSHGRVRAFGTPAEVIETGVISDIFDCRLAVGAVPEHGRPFVLPHAVIEGGGTA